MVARLEGDLVAARSLLDRWMDFSSPHGLAPEELRNVSARVESGFLAVQEGEIELAR